MKYLSIIIAGLLLSFGSVNGQKTVYYQLLDINSEWGKISQDAFPVLKEKRQITSEQEIIKLHLNLVEQSLRLKSDLMLDAEVQQKREEGLDILKAYADRGLFPINNHKAERTPVFIDNHQTHCAVGHIMLETGYGHVATSIKEEENLAYVFEIKNKDILDWAVEYGFTKEELAWIQPTYGPCWYGVYFNELSRTNPSCGGNDGSLSLELQGNQVLDYEWSHGANDLELNNLSAGVYTISGTYMDVQFGTECPFEFDFEIESDPNTTFPTNTANQTCTGIEDGMAEVNLGFAGSNYSVVWASGQTGPVINNLPYGRYYAIVTDNNTLCTSIENTWVSVQTQMYTYVSTEGTACDQNDGAIDLTIYGGLDDNYSYSWTNTAQTVEDPSNLTAGTYTVTVSDGYGCNMETEITVHDDCNGKINCFDDYIDVYNFGGTYLEVMINDTDPSGADIASINILTIPENGSAYPDYYSGFSNNKRIYYYNNQGFVGLDSFEYEICTDHGFCDNAWVYLNVTDQPVVSVVSANSNQDFNLCPGEYVELFAQGANSYVWSPAIGLSDPSSSYVVAEPSITTTYTVTGTDNYGNVNMFDVTINVSDPVEPVINNTNSNGVIITSGATPFVLSADPPGGVFEGDGVVFNAFNPTLVPPGMHEIDYVYTDDLGCAYESSANVLVFTLTFNFVNYNLGVISPKIIDLLIEATEPGTYFGEIIDMSGRILYAEQIEVVDFNQGHQIKTTTLPEGNYIFRLYNKDHQYSDNFIVTY